MTTLWQDLRYGLRMSLKKPAFTLIALVTLALGIGATTTVFSLIDQRSVSGLVGHRIGPDRLLLAFAAGLESALWRQ